MPTKDHLLDIAWVIPQVFKGSGGHTNIFRHIAYLSEFGHRNTIYCDDFSGQFRSDGELQDYIQEHFVDTKARVFRHWKLQPCDVVLATHWSTAYPVREFPHCSKKFYFVQDYEPLFHPISYEYLRAENTYRLGFSCVTLGRWLTHLLRERYSADCDYFNFAVDNTAYFVRPDVTPQRRIAFYSQPDKPRRCFDLGIQALEIVHRLHPEVEIVLFGSKAKPAFAVSFPHLNLGVISPRECADLYRSSSVGLILSASNPSLIPVEMMACGCPVVDLDRENNWFDYEPGSVSLADATPEALAQAITRLLEDDHACETQVRRALQMVSQRSFERSARKIEASLLKGWIAGHVSSAQDLRLDEFQSLAEAECSLETDCAQTFEATQDNLCELHVFLANPPGGDSKGSVVCELWDAQDDRMLATLRTPVSEIGNWAWHAFRFPVQPFSKWRTYRLVLHSGDDNGSYLRALYTKKPVYARGELFSQRERVPGTLKFKTYCAVQTCDKNPLTLQSSLPVQALTVGQRTQERLVYARRSPVGNGPNAPADEMFLKIVGTLKGRQSQENRLRGVSPYTLRETASALAYPKAGVFVGMARFLILIQHYLVWTRVHLREGGLKAVSQRVRRRLSFGFRPDRGEVSRGGSQ